MPVIKHQTYIKSQPAKVFQMLTTADGWNAWFTDRTTIAWNKDGTGEIRLRWAINREKMIEDGGKIIEATPDESFIFQWCPGESQTTVKFNVQPFREGTLLAVEEHGYSNKDIGTCIECAIGWGEALTLLKIYLEHGIVLKEDLFAGVI
ncbi:SRPBCC family protein [Cytobacillus massiliigabonensis]|uniref:SRPBCC family protein n=1 Tax=Cytobacillus massiliigabonensis TaxID=1871011 RepID=UPI0015E0E2C8|nr:SRPBCC domain-containing protein [Cytobacillus massiliigabonensis]